MFTNIGWLCLLVALDQPFAGKTQGDVGPVRVVQTYEQAPEEADIIYALDLSRDSKGSLVILEGKTNKVHIWNHAGQYLNEAGGPGQGPGESEDLLRVACGEKNVYGYQYPGPVVVWPRLDDGRLAPNSRARKVPLKIPFSQIFKPVRGINGKEVILLSGQNYQEDGMGLHRWFFFDPINGDLKELKNLQIKPDRPYFDLFNADGTKPLRICTPRSWAAHDGKGLMVGYSKHGQLSYLDNKGQLIPEIKMELPTVLPNRDHQEQFYNTQIPILLKTLKELKLGHLPFDERTPLANYTFFLPLDNGDILLVNTIFGGFNNVNYCLSGDTVRIYGKKEKKPIARGILQLPEEASLYLQDTAPILVRFDDEEMLVIEEVALGWL